MEAFEMAIKRTNPAFLNGVPEMLILHLLAGRPMHGYELAQAIKSATHEGLEFGEGCIYPILHRLESQGLLSATRQSVAGRQRVVYQATPKGKGQLVDTVGAWRHVVASINHALKGGERERPALA
jgi:PadR family transcriptional regulator, regulatory protein PadR